MASEQVTCSKTADYELQAVPQEARKSFFSVTMVWTGYVFVITSMLAGGGLAAGFSFKDILIVSVLGNLFLSVIAILMSYIASSTGLTFALITRHSFGIEGSRASSLFAPLVNMGWYTVQSAVYGHFIASLFNLSPVGESIAMIASAIVMGIFALIGIEALTVLGLVSIPAIIFLSVGSMLEGVSRLPGHWGELWSIMPKEPMTMAAGVTAVVGTWIFSASTCIADIMRYSKNMKEASLSALTGLVGGNSIMIVCGAATAMAVGKSDLTEVLISLKLLFPALVLMTTNIFTTNGANIYSNALGLSNVFRKYSSKSIMCVLLVISALCTLTKPYEVDRLFVFLDTLAKVVPPLPGIIMMDFFVIKRRRYCALDELKGPAINWNAVIAWVAATVIVFVLGDWGFPPLNGILLGGIIYYINMTFDLFGKKPEPTKQKINFCRTIAIIGIILMGIGSFASCLNPDGGLITLAGNILLALGLIISTYGFTYWRP